MKFKIGATNAGNIAVLGLDNLDCNRAHKRYLLVLKTGEWVQWANFPMHICTLETTADNAFAAAQAFAGQDYNHGMGESKGWELQRAAERSRNETHLQAFHDQIATENAARKAEAEALSIGQLRQKLTHIQFCKILEAARRNNKYSNIGDYFYSSALGDKLRAALDIKAKRKSKFGYGWKPIAFPPHHCSHWSLPDHQRQSPLLRFYVQLRDLRNERTRKKAAALAQRRAPMNALALHIARHYHRSDGKFGVGGDGVALGHGRGNIGSRKRGGPGTRAQAGVTVEKGFICLHPMRNGKIIKLPKPPRNLVKTARPMISHPLGLFCTTSEFPGVDLNWDLVTLAHLDVAPANRKKDWRAIGFSVRGVAVTERIARHEFSLDEALAETNQEVRRIMLERLPAEAVAEKLKVVHSDDFGTLYKEEDSTWNERQLAFVKVVNSTAEPDGTFKDYFLRVPGNMVRARQSIAWTFGLTEEQYQPQQQS